MRPIELQIAGLNSFRERQTINFEPLLAEGLFGIFGPTGSGKSSILDAITLALYGEVKRAPKGKGGIINMREKSCAVSFTFEVSVDGVRKRYTIERLIEREKKKGGITTKRARLSEHRNGERIPVAEKEKELDGRPQEPGKIHELIGINADDFLRSVILPQGAFANLLNLKPAERGEVMQRLFGLHDLGERLRVQLSRRSEEMEMLRAGEEGRISELRAYDDVALAEARGNLERAALDEATARERSDMIATALRQAEALNGLLEEERELLGTAPHREQRKQELVRLYDRIGRGERSRAVLPAIVAAEAAAKRYTDSEREYDAARRAHEMAATLSDETATRYSRIAASYDAGYDRLRETITSLKQIAGAMNELDGRRSELAELAVRGRAADEEHDACESEHRRQADHVASLLRRSEELADRRKRLRLTSDERERLDRLKSLVEREINLRERLEARQHTAAMMTKDLERIDREIEATRATESDYGSELALLQETIAGAKKELDDWEARLTAYRDKYQQLKDLPAHLHASFIKRIGERKTECDEHRRLTMGHESELRRVNFELDAAIEERRKANERMDGAAARLAEAERAMQLATLAAELSDGSPCPLCGSAHHPTPHHQDANGVERIERCRRDAERTRQVYKEIDERVRVQGEKAAMLRIVIDGARDSIRSIEEDIASLEASMRERLAAIEAERPVTSIAGLNTLLEDLIGIGVETKKMVEQRKEDLARLEERARMLRDMLATSAAAVSALLSELGVKQETHRTIAGELATMTAESSTIAAELVQYGEGSSKEEILLRIATAAERDREAEEIETTIAETDVSLREGQRVLGIRAADLADRARQRDTIVALRSQLAAEVERKQGTIAHELRALVPENDAPLGVEALIRRKEAERERLRSEYDETKREYEAAHAGVTARKAELDACWKTLCLNELERDTAARDLAGLLKEYGFDTADEARASSFELEELRAMKDLAASIDRDLRAAEQRLAELARLIGGRVLAEGELAMLRGRFEEARRERDSAIAVHGAAERNLAIVLEKNGELREALERQRDVADRAATVDQLRRYLSGNAFVNYLADERLAEVCRRASIQLEALTGGRLELCTRPIDGFFIRDYGNGGGERSTSSLSGGETFLVSLSLALALSDTIQLGRAPLEFFFLDEGFGTLDQDLLETVLDSLDRLRSQHRAIGVISHVGALRERINRRLVLTSAGEERGSHVRYEIA